MKNLEAREICRRIAYGSKSRCPNCRGRRFVVQSKEDVVRCADCYHFMPVDEFLERELSVYESKQPVTARTTRTGSPPSR